MSDAGRHLTRILQGALLALGLALLSLLPASNGQQSASILLPAKKGILASRMNLTHEHFSRILHDLSEAGLIAMTGRQIEVPDIARLRAAGGASGTPERPNGSGTGRANAGRHGPDSIPDHGGQGADSHRLLNHRRPHARDL